MENDLDRVAISQNFQSLAGPKEQAKFLMKAFTNSQTYDAHSSLVKDVVNSTDLEFNTEKSAAYLKLCMDNHEFDSVISLISKT